jgi:hypothetical protein
VIRFRQLFSSPLPVLSSLGAGDGDGAGAGVDEAAGADDVPVEPVAGTDGVGSGFSVSFV